MAKVRIHDSADIKWKVIEEAFPPEMLGKLQPALVKSRISTHEPGTANEPQLGEADYLPGACVDVHSHGDDEIIYVVSGSMMLGNRELPMGSSIFIAANTLYGFSAGSEGVRIAIFRTRGGGGSLSKEEHLARRSAMAASN